MYHTYKYPTTHTLLLLVFILSLTSCGIKKSDMLAKEWNATEVTLGETKLAASDLGGLKYEFKPDRTFIYTESDKTEQGRWAMNEDGSKVTLNFPETKRVVQQSVKELTADKLVLDYDDHGMHRTVVLSPAK